MGDDSVTKPAKDEGVEMRTRIFDLVHRYPGLHLRDIQRRASTSAALAEYHLNLLEKWGLVKSTKEHGRRRFFPARSPRIALSKDDQRVISLMRQRIPLGIVLLLLEGEQATHGELSTALNVHKSTMTYNLRKLIDAGVVLPALADGRALSLCDREHVLTLLRAYEPSPDLIGAYAQLWENLFDALWPGAGKE